MANVDRIGRYRVVRRIAESAFVARRDGVPSAASGVRLRCEAERRGTTCVARCTSRASRTKTRTTLTDSFVACLQLKSDNVVPFVDAGSFGDHVYGASVISDGVPLGRSSIRSLACRTRRRPPSAP
ncbi:MAG: hypothetical protein U0414_14120 [Polyangiaceae bacterium]